MRSKLLIAMVAALVLALAAPAAASSHESQVTVVHGIPGVTVDVWVNGDPLLEGFEPETVSDTLTLPADTYDIEIYAAGDNPEEADPVISASPEVPGGANLTVIAHLDAEGTPTLSAFANDVSEIADGEARLTARHTAAAPEVDVRANGDALFEGEANGAEGTVDVPADSYSADVVLAGESDPVIGPADLSLEAGTAYLVHAIGSAEEGTLGFVVQTISGLGADGDAEAPHSVPSGSGGAAAPAVPAWALMALAGGALIAVGSGARLAVIRK